MSQLRHDVTQGSQPAEYPRRRPEASTSTSNEPTTPMCLINNTHRFIYVHIPKCGGTAISLDLSVLTLLGDLEVGGTYFGELVQPAFIHRWGLSKHATAGVIRSLVGQDIWTNYFTFASVRNPFTRVVSTFRFLKGWREWEGSEVMDEIESVDQFVSHQFFVSDCELLRTQTSFVGTGTSSEVKRTFRLEEYDEWINSFFETRGRTYQRIDGFRNESDASLPKDALRLSDRSVEEIRARYADDFAAFGYDLTPPSSVI